MWSVRAEVPKGRGNYVIRHTIIIPIDTCLQPAQHSIYHLIRLAPASKIWGQSLSLPYDTVHGRVYAIRGIFISKVTEHQSGRSYRG